MTPDNWAEKFESAHGFNPPFTADEMDAPWCDECSDFHHSDEEHSDTSAMLFPKGYSV